MSGPRHRTAEILQSIVTDYIATAAPVGSVRLAREHPLGVSPATIRNEMVKLEEDGYIVRPHTSSGGIPSDKGYRFFVERLPLNLQAHPSERRLLRVELNRVMRDIEAWVRVASSVLSSLVGTLAFATAPRTRTSRVKQIELLPLQELMALLVLILHGASVHKLLIPLREPVAPQALARARGRLAGLLVDRTATEIEQVLPPARTDLESDVIDTTLQVLRSEESAASLDYAMSGLAELFAQPEFANPGPGRDLVATLEEKQTVARLVSEAPEDGSVVVVIGSENRNEALRAFSVVLCRYGVPGEASGVIGLIGPTRLPYHQALPITGDAANALSELLAGVFPGPHSTLSAGSASAI